jgi:valyl-tRNA synthetase
MKKKKRGEKKFLKDNFNQSISYIKASRNFIYAIILVFVFSIVLGAFFPVPREILEKISSTKDKIGELTKEFKFSEALSCTWELISFADKYVNDRKPWAEKDNTQTLVNALTIIDNVAALLAPYLPATSEKITKSIIWNDLGLRVVKSAALFPRV